MAFFYRTKSVLLMMGNINDFPLHVHEYRRFFHEKNMEVLKYACF